jgi:hypothetical protein
MIGKLISKTFADIITIPIRLPKDIIDAVDKAIDPDEDKKDKL